MTPPQGASTRVRIPSCGVPSCSAMPKERLPGLPNCFLPILCCVCNPHLFVHYHTIHFGSSAFMGGQLWAFPRGATTHHIWLLPSRRSNNCGWRTSWRKRRSRPRPRVLKTVSNGFKVIALQGFRSWPWQGSLASSVYVRIFLVGLAVRPAL